MNASNDQRACAEWNDQRMIGDLLSTAKHLAGEYNTLVCEGSDPAIRSVFQSNLQQTQDDQFTLFDHMRARGWYQTQDAQAQDIDTARQQFTQTKSELM